VERRLGRNADAARGPLVLNSACSSAAVVGRAAHASARGATPTGRTGTCARVIRASGGHLRGRRGDVVLVGTASEPSSRTREHHQDPDDETLHLGHPTRQVHEAADSSRRDCRDRSLESMSFFTPPLGRLDRCSYEPPQALVGMARLQPDLSLAHEAPGWDVDLGCDALKQCRHVEASVDRV